MVAGSRVRDGRADVVTVCGFDVYVRESRISQDKTVIDETIRYDQYNLEGWAKNIDFNPSVILDIGGHIGTFGLLAKKFWPDAFLIAVEPQIISAQLYELNMDRNKISNYYIFNAGVHYNPKFSYLVEPKTSSGGGFMASKSMLDKITAESGYEPSQSEVPTITIEQIVERFDLDVIDFVKLDCEGSELSIFHNILPETAAKFRVMAGEYHISGKNGELFMGTKEDYDNFWALAEAKFPHLKFDKSEYKTIPDYRTIGCFQAFPKCWI